MKIKELIKGTYLEAPLRRLHRVVAANPAAASLAVREPNRSELRVLASATNLVRSSGGRSIMFFTTHKCASTFVSRILTEIDTATALEHFDYAQAIWKLGDAFTGDDPYGLLSSENGQLFFPHGEVYGPMRRPVRLEAPDSYRMIFFLRDPRDVLVSAYYSFGFSHPLPEHRGKRADFLARRKQIQEEGIDCYAIRAAGDWLGPIYSEYQRLRGLAAASVFISYDDYATDPAAAIRRIFAFCDAPTTGSAVEALSASASPISEPREDGDGLRHKRSGRSGQFRTALSAETIDQLNDILAPSLKAWGFEK